MKKKLKSLCPSDATCPASFVRMFQPQFADLVARGEKCQTVRPIPKRMPKIGDHISLRAWSDKPYRSKQKLLADGVITRVVPITITDTAVLIRPTPKLTVHVPRGPFAVADGFSCWEEMRQWFAHQHGLPFDGVLISWQNKTMKKSEALTKLASAGRMAGHARTPRPGGAVQAASLLDVPARTH